MRLLSDILKEKVTDVKWLNDSLYYVRNYYFPLTNSIAKELGIGKRITAIHFTSPKKAMRLISLQGTKKSISVMTKVPKISALTINGIHEAGVIYKLEGDVLVSAKADIMSQPDQRGRRWIELTSLGRSEFPDSDRKATAISLSKNYRRFLQNNDQYDSLGEKLKKLNPDFTSDPEEFNTVAKQLISLHFDLSLEFVKQNSDTFSQLFPSAENDQIEIAGWDWNEIIVNNIELIGVAYNLDDPDLRTTSGEALKNKIINSVPEGKAVGFDKRDPQILDWILE